MQSHAPTMCVSTFFSTSLSTCSPPRMENGQHRPDAVQLAMADIGETLELTEFVEKIEADSMAAGAVGASPGLLAEARGARVVGLLKVSQDYGEQHISIVITWYVSM